MKRQIIALIISTALLMQLAACAQNEAPSPSESQASESAVPVESEPESRLAAEPASEPEASVAESSQEEPVSVSAAPEQSTAFHLNPDDITIYVQDPGEYTVSDFSLEADEKRFTQVINSLNASLGGNRNPEGAQDATYLLVRNDYQKFTYNLISPVLCVDEADYSISEADYQVLLDLADSNVCGTYAQWLVFMNPNRVEEVTVHFGESTVSCAKGDPVMDELVRAMRWVGVQRGSGETYTDTGAPYEQSTGRDDYMQVRMLFDNGLYYTANFDGDAFLLESDDISFGCKYRLSNAADRELIKSAAFGTNPVAENPATAKPVIYLYPQTAQDIQVQLDFRGELGYTFPAYNGGWDVTAQPDGMLTNKADGSTHYYLFWDGTPDRKQWDFSKGFVVPGEEVERFFLEKLPLMGLSPREYNDFITYWTPELQQNRYNLITFSTTEYEETAPLTVTPAPDTVLRVHMVYMPIYEPIEIEEPELPTAPPQRDGFTVVEWGGTRAHKLR